MEIILFILFVVASVVFRILQPRIKGYLGEKSVATILSLLPSDKYKIINDLLIEVDGRTIQIDHLVVSIYGIFVIETKNYKGRITGSDNSDYWTKNMFGNKYTFYNPIRQNKSHVLALSKQLGFSLNKFIPIIVFSNGAELKVNTTHNVIYTTQINRVIKEYSEIKFSETDIQKLYDKISLLNIVSPEVRKQHVLEIQNTIATKRHLIQQGICPRCGHSLILRNGKYGNFYGCSNYPGILKDKTLDFISLFAKSPISRFKSASIKTHKIGLNKSLFKNKKSATNAEFSKMVPLARIGLATPPLPRRATVLLLCCFCIVFLYLF